MGTMDSTQIGGGKKDGQAAETLAIASALKTSLLANNCAPNELDSFVS